MSSRFWASSEDISSESVDSSIAGVQDQAQDESRDSTSILDGLSLRGEREVSNRQNAVVARTMANNTGVPDLQPYQRANLFYLALIEGRCRTQACAVINSSRGEEEKVGEDHPEVLDLSRHMYDEVRRELVKVGMLSEEFASGDQPQLHTYLTSFDNILDNIATQQTRGLSGHQDQALSGGLLPHILGTNTSVSNLSNSLIPHQLARQPLRAGSPSSNSNFFGNNTSVFNSTVFNTSGALVPGNLFVTPDNFPMGLTSSFQTLLRHVFPGEDHSKHVVATDASHYAANFIQLSKLGAGGFGAVYKVRNKFDKGIYAVKKIVVKREELQELYDNNKICELASLIKEVQTLAKLQHHNIVSYQHFWMEARSLDESYSSSSSDDENDEEETSEAKTFPSLSLASLSIDNEYSLEHEMRVQRRRGSSCISAEIAADIDAGHILFSDENSSSMSQSRDLYSNSQKEGNKDSDEEEANVEEGSEDSEEDTEEIIRYDGQIVRSPKKNLRHAEFDLVLYIKMAPYPLSLQDYIRQHTDKAKSVDIPDIQHCFHIGPTVKLLLSMLDGIEYIHRKSIVHRDLKPGNILLQILDLADKPTSGFVNTSECSGCSSSSPTWISPRIGDFGLVHDLSSSSPTISAAAAKSGTTSTAPGTATYLPLNLRKSSVICAKLDVYSLGIIAFEMCYQFGTSTERVFVLEKLKRSGEVPKDFEEHPLKECILGMVKENVKERWDCLAVREFLESVLGGL